MLRPRDLKILVFSDGSKQPFEPCPIVVFGVLLFCLDKNSSDAYGRCVWSVVESTKVTLVVEALNH